MTSTKSDHSDLGMTVRKVVFTDTTQDVSGGTPLPDRGDGILRLRGILTRGEVAGGLNGKIELLGNLDLNVNDADPGKKGFGTLAGTFKITTADLTCEGSFTGTVTPPREGFPQ